MTPSSSIFASFHFQSKEFHAPTKGMTNLLFFVDTSYNYTIMSYVYSHLLFQKLAISMAWGYFICMQSYGALSSSEESITFDPTNTSVPVVTITTTGMGVCTTPTTTLDVSGNTIISESLAVGSVSGNSTLEINGSLTMTPQFVSSNITLGGYNTALVDSSSGNITVTLPDVASSRGMTYTIKKTTFNNTVTVSGGGTPIDRQSLFLLSGTASSSQLPILTVVSDGSRWHSMNSTGTTWSPSCDNLILAWYDPSDSSTITSLSGNVSQLWDKSSNELHLAQATPADQPETDTRSLNGLNILDCVEGEHLIYDPFPINTGGNLMVFMVYIVDIVNGTADCIMSMNATRDWQIDSYDGSEWIGRIEQDNIGGSNAVLQGGPYSGPSIFCAVFDINRGLLRGIIDGYDRENDIDTYTTAMDSSMYLRVYGNRSGAQFLDGAFGEIIITAAVDDQTRQWYEGYLAHKWGLTANLGASHPYKSTAP
ncbi:MAG: hypothetical protein HQL32_09140 [Planctomycetes bacterium]|nr:hypothetical protein [Planctomycetota bacterium]